LLTEAIEIAIMQDINSLECEANVPS